MDDKAGLYTYLYDGQGNVTQNLRDGKEANSYYYDPFGKVESGTEANDVIFGYNGEEYTEATGLQYLRQRHYAPDAGTFLAKDSYRGDLYEPASQDRYGYAGNDPVNHNDPGGDKKTSKNPKKSGKGRTSGVAAGTLVAGAAKQIAKTVRNAAVQAATKTAAKASQRKSGSQKTLSKQEAQVLVNQGIQAMVGLKEMAKSLQTGVSCKGGKRGEPPG